MVFFALSMPFREFLSVSEVTEVRLSALLNPILGLLYGWPVAIGCAIANLIADIVSGYSLAVILLGFIPQLLYGIIPYYLWKAVVPETRYFEINFMRMGEPSLNPDLLAFIEKDLKETIDSKVNADIIYPYISTMLPKNYKHLREFILEFCRIKNEVYHGSAGMQFSITTTDEESRNAMFGNRSLSIPEIAEIAKSMPVPLGPKYALNFAVTKDSVIESKYIDSLFDKNKFMIKITPIHETFNAKDNGFAITTEYDSYEVFGKFEDNFKALGWDVIVFLDSREEDEDDLTCGKLLLSYE